MTDIMTVEQYRRMVATRNHTGNKKAKARVKLPRNTDSPDIFPRLVMEEYNLECIREYLFHETRKWRFDYAIPSIKMAIEVEGGIWSNGRHIRGVGFMGDMIKYNEAALLGWTLYRTTPQKLQSSETFNAIKSQMTKYSGNEKTDSNLL